MGAWSGTYLGTYVLAGTSTAVNNAGSAQFSITASGDTLTVVGTNTSNINGTCTIAALLAGDTASYSNQPCTFSITTTGQTQTNTASGTISLSGPEVVIDESGTFSGSYTNGLTYSGSYQGTWTLTAQ